MEENNQNHPNLPQPDQEIFENLVHKLSGRKIRGIPLSIILVLMAITILVVGPLSFRFISYLAVSNIHSEKPSFFNKCSMDKDCELAYPYSVCEGCCESSSEESKAVNTDWIKSASQSCNPPRHNSVLTSCICSNNNGKRYNAKCINSVCQKVPFIN